jgi:predicted dehydrogenase
MASCNLDRTPLSQLVNMERKLMRVAFVGCGYVFDIYMRTKWAYPEMEICGVYDIDIARSSVVARHYGIHVYPSYEALLSDKNVDIVLT